MVKIKENQHIKPDGSIDIEAWLTDLTKKKQKNNIKQITQACQLSHLVGGEKTLYNQHTCLHEGLKMAEILFDLNADPNTVAAAILYNNVQFAELSLEDVAEQISAEVAELIKGSQQIEAIREIFHHRQQQYQQSHIDNLRKMLLSMVKDVRAVLIKLAEKLCIMRSANQLTPPEQQNIANESLHIFAPLASRLGIWHIKWELEDLSLRYLEPQAYKEIAKLLDQRRIEREQYVTNAITILNKKLLEQDIKDFEMTGRAKHIYSIYKKMKRKDVNYDQIYDVSAVRVLVKTIEDCYSTLGIVHGMWKHIPEEFDDYISKPKPNGYRSLHTAVVGPENRNLEVQIRTFDMHNESELGIAAHWKYKEQKHQHSAFDEKIVWLRQLLDWQRELTNQDANISEKQKREIFDDRVYVFTPAGEIIDLPAGATPLDFAYQIHSQVGHHCCGAKINGNIVPLTYQLKTGESIEVLTNRHTKPSRDWLNINSGYLTSARARAKVHHWFKKQDYAQHLHDGQLLVDPELRRHHIKRTEYDQLLNELNLHSIDDLYVAVGNSDIRISQVLQAIKTMHKQTPSFDDFLHHEVSTKQTSTNIKSDISIENIDHILTFKARCCKPVPGDDIIGFITKGRGVSIHRQDCFNIINSPYPQRLIGARWNTVHNENRYPVDLSIEAIERQGLVKDILSVISEEKAHLEAIQTSTQWNKNLTFIALTIQISNSQSLEKLISSISHVGSVLKVYRQLLRQK